ncbi:CheR family methyltransferase [Pseudoduganella violacea]|uniref:Chemotaxis protein methyltransferase CheR n=1 Tax=Pseudoduganella violacea TaxID=1715466 RepID=A0A7W5BF57_9BURK|nr:protein-glutamate O-methyltransferase CheR [Pseudoduganella violacea]MBB3121765.1 chemotaxis protein methyltransferase CheR [Pseudoduganella violacea]
MNADPTAAQVLQFRDLIAQRLGLQFDDTRLAQLARVLNLHAGGNSAAYLSMLGSASNSAEALHRLAADLTVTETYFYRNAEQIDAFVDLAMPSCWQAHLDGSPVRVLSAGCASGEEPYTLAIAVREAAGLGAHSLALRAVDANPAMLVKAARARYAAWSLRELPPEIQARWFVRDGEMQALKESVRRSVRFEQRNLAQDDEALWGAGRYDIVFCRNVLMYFTLEQVKAAVARIAASLVPGGYLFLGHAETLRGVSSDFHLCHSHATFYYQRRQLATAEEVAPAVPLTISTRALQGTPLDDFARWGEVIDRASQRIHALTATPLTAPPGEGKPAQPDLRHALMCLHKEQFEQTLTQINQLPPAYADDPDVLLLKAVSLSQSGALVLAQDVCQRLLARDELNAGAHYVKALCKEEEGACAEALECYRSAAYLDPGFALARLHIGLLERRMGDMAAARHDLAQALMLLQHEDPARLLLFGGGFPRSALIGLCQAELAAFGEEA